jgi:hypothetical protein
VPRQHLLRGADVELQVEHVLLEHDVEGVGPLERQGDVDLAAGGAGRVHAPAAGADEERGGDLVGALVAVAGDPVADPERDAAAAGVDRPEPLPSAEVPLPQRRHERLLDRRHLAALGRREPQRQRVGGVEREDDRAGAAVAGPDLQHDAVRPLLHAGHGHHVPPPPVPQVAERLVGDGRQAGVGRVDVAVTVLVEHPVGVGRRVGQRGVGLLHQDGPVGPLHAQPPRGTCHHDADAARGQRHLGRRLGHRDPRLGLGGSRGDPRDRCRAGAQQTGEQQPQTTGGGAHTVRVLPRDGDPCPL